MRTVKTVVYKFSELSTEIQHRVIRHFKWFRWTENHHEIWDDSLMAEHLKSKDTEYYANGEIHYRVYERV